MFFSDKLDLIELDFMPKGHCLSAARVEWKNVILNAGVAQSFQPLVDLSNHDLTDLVWDLFGPLQFSEIAQLYGALSKTPATRQAMNWQSYFSKQKMRFNSRTQDIIALWLHLPKGFQIWSTQRDLSPQDFAPLLALKNIEPFVNLSDDFAKANPSRNEGKQIIDLLVDLIMMNKDWQELRPSHDPWLSSLQKMRYPMRESLDQKIKQALPALPRYMEIKQLKQGDQTLRRLQITYSDRDDLTAKIQRLQNIETL